MMAGKFLTVKCRKCKNEQTIFEKPSTKVKCRKCDQVIALPTGGKADVRTTITGVIKEKEGKIIQEKVKSDMLQEVQDAAQEIQEKAQAKKAQEKTSPREHKAEEKAEKAKKAE
jgi:small subunit ribosomal protein S27e